MKKILIFISFLILITQLSTSFAIWENTNILNKVEINWKTTNSLPLAWRDTRYWSSIENMWDINWDWIVDIAVWVPKNRWKWAVYIHFLKSNWELKKTNRLDNYSLNWAEYDLWDEYWINIKNMWDLDSNWVNEIWVSSNKNIYIHYLYDDGSIKETIKYNEDELINNMENSPYWEAKDIWDLDWNWTNDLIVGNPENWWKITIYFLENNQSSEDEDDNSWAWDNENEDIWDWNSEDDNAWDWDYGNDENTWDWDWNWDSEENNNWNWNDNNTWNWSNEDNDNIEVSGFIYPSYSEDVISEVINYKPNKINAEFHRIDVFWNLVLMDEWTWWPWWYSRENIETLKSTNSEVYTTVTWMKPVVTAFSKSWLKRVLVAQELTDFVVENDITWVDVDIEEFWLWTPLESDAYTSFLYELWTRLHANWKKLTVNIPAIWSEKDSEWYYLKYNDFNTTWTYWLSWLIDTYLIMAYDYMYDYWIWEPIQPLERVWRVIDYSKNILDINKISIGINSYWYTWINWTYSPKIKTYNQIKGIHNFSSAVRDVRSWEMYWNNWNNHYRYVDTEWMNIKKDYILSKWINKISVWHLWWNKWFY